MHLDEEQLQRRAHGELAPDQRAAVDAHLAECVDCRALLARVEREETEIAKLLGALDEPAPAVRADEIARRARRAWRLPVQWAAGFLLAAGITGIAYAIPGSPLPRLFHRALERMGLAGTVDGAGSAAKTGSAGVAVAPGARLTIQFQSLAPEAVIRISLTGQPDVSIHAPSGGATFTTSGDLVQVANGNSGGGFVVLVPRAAPNVAVRVGDREVFHKVGPRVTADVPEEANATYRISGSRLR